MEAPFVLFGMGGRVIGNAPRQLSHRETYCPLSVSRILLPLDYLEFGTNLSFSPDYSILPFYRIVFEFIILDYQDLYKEGKKSGPSLCAARIHTDA